MMRVQLVLSAGYFAISGIAALRDRARSEPKPQYASDLDNHSN